MFVFFRCCDGTVVEDGAVHKLLHSYICIRLIYVSNTLYGLKFVDPLTIMLICGKKLGAHGHLGWLCILEHLEFSFPGRKRRKLVSA